MLSRVTKTYAKLLCPMWITWLWGSSRRMYISHYAFICGVAGILVPHSCEPVNHLRCVTRVLFLGRISCLFLLDSSSKSSPILLIICPTLCPKARGSFLLSLSSSMSSCLKCSSNLLSSISAISSKHSLSDPQVEYGSTNNVHFWWQPGPLNMASVFVCLARGPGGPKHWHRFLVSICVDFKIGSIALKQ